MFVLFFSDQEMATGLDRDYFEKREDVSNTCGCQLPFILPFDAKKQQIQRERMRLPIFARSEGKFSSVVSVSLSLFSSSISSRSISFKLR